MNKGNRDRRTHNLLVWDLFGLPAWDPVAGAIWALLLPRDGVVVIVPPHVGRLWQPGVVGEKPLHRGGARRRRTWGGGGGRGSRSTLNGASLLRSAAEGTGTPAERVLLSSCWFTSCSEFTFKRPNQSTC